MPKTLITKDYPLQESLSAVSGYCPPPGADKRLRSRFALN